jgi:hypothetical protein
MGWIKRNLFFVAGGILALGLLGGAGFFIYTGWARNSEMSDKLNEIYGKLAELAQAPVQPGNDKIDNKKIAQEQEKQVRDWMDRATNFFSPIPPIPEGSVTSKTYATALGTTIYQLQQEAKDDSVTLPPEYYFSFQVQNNKLTISSASLDPLAAQLGEVKAIAEILYAARINALDGIQRVRVSDDDMQGLQSDYIDERPTTNQLAILTPYVVTFRSFTPELARVISGFATSPNAFIIKSISVQPAGAAMTAAPQAPAYGPGGPMMGHHGEAMPMPMPEQPPPMAGRGGLQTVLKEQLLRITMEVEIVKLLPKS